MNKRNYEVYLDLDETVVCLSQYIVEECYNKDFHDNMKWQENDAYWWGDCKKAPKLYFEQLLLKRGTFALPKPVDGAIETITKLHNEGFDIHILTMPTWNSLYCVQEKVQWVQKYLPFIDINTHFHCTGNKGILAKSNRILLDDNGAHLKAWSENHGTAVAFGGFSWNADWTGDRANNFDEFYDLVHKLEEENTRVKNDNGIDIEKLRGYYKYNLYGEDL